MKLKDLLHVVYYENEVKFVILSKDTDENEEFFCKVYEKELEKYNDYFVSLVDMEENLIAISEINFYE